MTNNDLRDYMLQRTVEIQSEYKRIQKRSGEDAGTAGDNGEENWKEIFEDWLPPIYPIVTKGRIMNSQGICGPQVDILILSPWYPKKLLNKKEYLEGGILAAFECKLTLTGDHIQDTIENSVKIRRNSYTAKHDTPYQATNHSIIYGLLAQSHSWKKSKSKPIDNIEKYLHKTEVSIAGHPRDALDIICVANLATWKLQKLFYPPQLFSQVNEQLATTFKAKYGDFPYQRGIVEAGYIRFSNDTQHMPDDQNQITPVGNLIAYLLERLAWNDKGLRPLAEYFIQANITGSGKGQFRTWAVDQVFPEALANQVQRGGRNMSGRWNEWGQFL
ncbi:MAG: DUF6602 domain-containing protein [Cyanobacteria bacterium P01_F01_bin.116]